MRVTIDGATARTSRATGHVRTRAYVSPRRAPSHVGRSRREDRDTRDVHRGPVSRGLRVRDVGHGRGNGRKRWYVGGHHAGGTAHDGEAAHGGEWRPRPRDRWTPGAERTVGPAQGSRREDLPGEPQRGVE